MENIMTIPFKSVPLRVLRTLLLLVFVAGAFGCADGEFRFGDPFDREVTLSESQHRYTVLIRWNEFQKARSFVHNDDIGEFLAQTKTLKNARFTDYESEPVELDDEKETATIRVTYTLYTPSVPYELQIAEIQEWHRDGLSNDWRVRSTFEGLQQIASN
jgi:hypothetical protein